jgi:(p)ppGpp synthase/HD superfamily hydrolase
VQEIELDDAVEGRVMVRSWKEVKAEGEAADLAAGCDAAINQAAARKRTEFVLDDAIRIAREAHTGQVDKSGNPYIDHPLRVMARVKGADAQMVAVLHDVIEDTGVTADDLRAAGCPENVVTSVITISKIPGEPRLSYLRRVSGDPLAVIVKRADIADNTDPVRLAALDEETRNRLREKYTEAIRVLDELTA